MTSDTHGPTRKDLMFFGAILLVFFVLVGRLYAHRPGMLYVAGIVTGTALALSLLFNRETPIRRQLAGVFIPGLLLGVTGAARLGVAPATVVWGLAALGLVGALATWLSAPAGRRIYAGWLQAAVPIGWTLSLVILLAIYCLLLTPTGLLMRAFGKDPMNRKWEPEAATYWIERTQETSVERYFRQY